MQPCSHLALTSALQAPPAVSKALAHPLPTVARVLSPLRAYRLPSKAKEGLVGRLPSPQFWCLESSTPRTQMASDDWVGAGHHTDL